MLEEIDAALHRAKSRARQHEELNRQRADFSSRLDATRAQIAELEGRLSPDWGNEHGERVDPAAIQGMLHGLRARMSEVTGWLQHLDQELAGFQSAQQDYAAALNRKEETLRGSGDPRGPELIDIARRFAEVEASLQRHQAAYQAGADARRSVNAMRGDLEVARKYSNRDIRGAGPDLLTNISKLKRTQEADLAAGRARKELGAFAQRLADIGVTANPKLDGVAINPIGDVIFDNILSDAAAHENIVMSGAQADDMVRWLTRMLDWLRERQQGLVAERTDMLTRREALLLGEAPPAGTGTAGAPGWDTGTAAATRTEAAGALPEEIDHGVRAAGERVRRHDQMSRRHAALAPRLESVVSRLTELKRRIEPLETRVGQVKTASFTGLLASLSAGGGGRTRKMSERAELESLRLVTTALRARKQQLLDDLQAVQRERDELGQARTEHEEARTRQASALRGHPRAGELAELTGALGEVDADLRGHEEAGRAAEEAVEALADVRRALGSEPGGGRAAPDEWGDHGGPRGLGGLSARGGLGGLAARGGPGDPGDLGGPGGAPGPGGTGELHDADRAAWQAQRALDALAGWLGGIGIGTDGKSALPETRRFAEALLDSIVTDLTQHRRIVTAASRVDDLARWATQTAEWLRGRREEIEARRADLYERCARAR